MDRIQQRILEIAQQIPEYVGYQAKDRRRDADKHVRRQLAAKYEEQRMRLSRFARRAPLQYIVDLENLDQKLQRLTARLQTAPGGYAGWFDAAQIVESDLDQMTQFDAALTEGVPALKSVIDRVGASLGSGSGVDAAIGACADLLDSLNAQFDQREQFLAMGKKPLLAPDLPPMVSPLAALEAKKAPRAETERFSTLKLQDAVTFANVDYIVSGKITFAASQGTFWAFLLKDGKDERWLRVGPADLVCICRVVEFAAQSPFPDSAEYNAQTLTRDTAGTANVTVEGVGGARRGSVEYARYSNAAGSQLWLEDYGTEMRAFWGQVVDPIELRTYRR